MERVKRGDLVEVRFLDHCKHEGKAHGVTGPLPCIVFGRIKVVNTKYIHVVVWEIMDSDAQFGQEGYSILRSAITRIRRLR
jgi:hypothetical protein